MADEPNGRENQQSAEDDGKDPEVPVIRGSLAGGADADNPHKETDGSSNYAERTKKFLKMVWSVVRTLSFWTAAATVTIAVTTIIYTVYSGRQWDVAREGLSLNQRAWVSPVRDQFRLTAGSEIIIPSHMVNTGKTPAKHIEGWFTATVLKRDEVPDFIYTPGTGHPAVKAEARFVWPEEKIPFQMIAFKHGTQTGEHIILTKEMLGEWDRGESYLVMHGKITYDDVFDVHHWITFCDIFLADHLRSGLLNPAQVCARYNDMDKNK
ncbi:MAG: hypothetical protein ABSA70_16425 [Terriglobia bacterium]